MSKNSKNDPEKKLSTKAEGKEAVSALFDELAKSGVLIDRERTDMLEKKVSNLEKEVELLKDLVSRALNVKNSPDVLKG